MHVTRPTLFLLLAIALAACGSDDASAGGGGTGGTGGPPVPASPWRFGGPLANAGADQRVLEGMPVVLDARSSQEGEEGLPIVVRWTQEAGPRVMLDDPNAMEAWFVAPPWRPGEGAQLVFRLTVDDGPRTSADRVLVEVVRDPARVVPAPIAVGGPDLQVRPGAEVMLESPFTLDPACLDEGGDPGCELEEIPTRFVQIGVTHEADRVSLEEGRFTAPDHETVLTFRLDAHRRGAVDRLADCGPEGNVAGELPFCSGADHVRVLVNSGGTNRPPAASLLKPPELPGRGGLLRIGPERDASVYAEPIAIIGHTHDPDSDNVTLRRFRPLLGTAPAGPLARENQSIDLGHEVIDPTGTLRRGWPRTVAVAFESRARRLFSAPAVAAVRWEAPEFGPAVPVAHAGDNPCRTPLCTPLVGGDLVTLDASRSSDADTPADELVYCWSQTFGPRVNFAEGASCLQGVPTRTFVAPAAPPGGKALVLSFVLTVDDGGPLLSRPDAAIVQIRPFDNEAPEVVVVGPAEVDEGEEVLLDASGSTDPEGGSLSFAWGQVTPAANPVSLRPAACPDPDAPAGACVRFTAPAVTRDTSLRFEVTVFDEAEVDATSSIELLVRNSNNDPPVVDAGADRVAAPGATVTVEGSASDPNPGDDEGLRWSWAVIEGGVTLEARDEPAVRFVAPSVAADLEVVLEATVEDAHGTKSSDRVRVSVLADGPWVLPAGDDEAPGSRDAPVASVARGLEIAAAHGFRTLHLAGGDHALGAAELAVDGVTLRGGYDADWIWSDAVETRLHAGGGIALGEGAGLELLAVDAAAPAAQVVRVQGEASLREVVVNGRALAAGSAAVRVEAGSLRMEGGSIAAADGSGGTTGLACIGPAALDVRGVRLGGGSGAGDRVGVHVGDGCGGVLRQVRVEGGSGGARSVGLRLDGAAPVRVESARIEGGSAATTSVGIEVVRADDELELINGVVLAGNAPTVAVLQNAGDARLHSSLLRVLPGGAAAHASALHALVGSTADLRNVILDDGGTAANRAHLRGALPAVLARVLFVPATGCGPESAYVRTPSSVACSEVSIRNLSPGWEPLVADPLWVDAAAGDFHLGAGSAAVDAGTSDLAPLLDFDGMPRGGDGNGDGTPGFDLGPFER